MMVMVKSTWAKAILILQPPLNSFVCFSCISKLKPSPVKMIEALAGALSASINSIFSKTLVSKSPTPSF